MTSPPPDVEDVPCERCLDWRVEQSHWVAAHIVDVLTAILSDLGHDVRDERVKEVVTRHLRAVDGGVTG